MAQMAEDSSEQSPGFSPEQVAGTERAIPVESLNFFMLHGSFQFRAPKWEKQFKNLLIQNGIAASQIHTPHLKNLFANYHSWRKDSKLPNKEEDSEKTVIIGHSSGSEMALAYAEHHPLAGMILFAPYDTPDIGSKVLRPILKPIEKGSGIFTKKPKIPAGVDKALWQSDRVERDFRWDRIVKNCGFVTIVHSKGDHVVPEERSRSVYEKLLEASRNLLNAAGDQNPKILYLDLEGNSHNPEEKQFPKVVSTIPGIIK